MTRVANQFENPETSATYDWTINHYEESDSGPQRSVEHGANAANTGLVRHQADDQPMVLKYSGTILTEAQLTEMISWYILCKTQTIYFHDFAGDSYEVLITKFNYKRKWVQRNFNDPTNAPNHIWEYSIEMDIIRVIDGPLSGLVT